MNKLLCEKLNNSCMRVSNSTESNHESQNIFANVPLYLRFPYTAISNCQLKRLKSLFLSENFTLLKKTVYFVNSHTFRSRFSVRVSCRCEIQNKIQIIESPCCLEGLNVSFALSVMFYGITLVVLLTFPNTLLNVM